MSKRCPDCLHVNEDDRIFCAFCGATLDQNLRLIQNLEKQIQIPAQPGAAPKKAKEDVDEEYVPPVRATQKESGLAPLIIVGLLLIAAVVWLLIK